MSGLIVDVEALPYVTVILDDLKASLQYSASVSIIGSDIASLAAPGAGSRLLVCLAYCDQCAGYVICPATSEWQITLALRGNAGLVSDSSR